MKHLHFSNRARFVIALILVFLTLLLWAAVPPANASESPEVEAGREALEASLPPQPGDDQPITIEMGVTVGDLRLANLYYTQWGVERQGRIDMNANYEGLQQTYGKLYMHWQEERDLRIELERTNGRLWIAVIIGPLAGLGLGLLLGLLL